MHILSVATTYPRGTGDSEPAFVHHLNRGLVQLGHRVTCFVPHAAGAARQELLDGVEVRRFRYFAPERYQRLFYDGGALPSLRRSWLARANLPAFLTRLEALLHREMRNDTYDVMHAHWLFPTGAMAARVNHSAGIPLVATAHAGDVFTDNVLFRNGNRYALRHCDLITVNSRGTGRQVDKLLPGADYIVIPAAGVEIDPELGDVTAARRYLGGGEPLILSLGRLAEKKGIIHLIRAMPRILAALPGARLAIVGDGDQRSLLEREVAHLDLGRAVRFLGPMPQIEVQTHMAAADLFVLPSVYDSGGDTEGLGVVLLEALTAGTPVVASDIGGITDIVENERTGLLAISGDADSLARACLRMLGDKELQRATVAAARRHIDEHFSTRRIARRFEAAFNDAIAKRHPRERARAGA